MHPSVSRTVWAFVLLLLLTSCVSFSPIVRKAPDSRIVGYDLVYFTFGDAWPANHSMSQALQQEFERHRFVVLLEEPKPALWDRTLRLRLDLATNVRVSGRERADRLSHLGFRLEQMTDGKEVGRVIYQGLGLDQIEQRDLAEEIVDELLKGS